jgi:nicotinate-nucleotide adenylyltransferase
MTEPTPRRQIGLFGGSFNPPHVCHTLASAWALQTQPIDEVWWMPTYQHAFGKDLAPYEDRLEMCRLATRDLSRVRIHDIERRLGGESRTIDTVQALKLEEPDADFWLIVGTDILAERHKWKNWDGLMELVQLIVVGRSGYESFAAAGDLAAGFSLPQVSSTAIRQALRTPDDTASDELIRAWVQRDVRAHVHAHHLYL